MATLNFPSVGNFGGGNISGFGGSFGNRVAQNTSAGTTPSWLQPNMNELQNTYQSIPNQVSGIISPLRNAYQNTINYNTTLGTQAANSAGTEFANRAAQSGGSALGAGVARAQSLLPVFAQNATARQQEANTEAGYRMSALDLQGKLASQMADLRTNYAGTLANYMTQQRGQDINQQQFWATRSNDAARTLLDSKQPYGSYETNNQGQIVSGQNSYQNYMTDMQQRQRAKASLANQLF